MSTTEPTGPAEQRCSTCNGLMPKDLPGLNCPACLMRVVSPSAEPQPPPEAALASSPIHASIRYVGDYELLAELGRGGMGVVYQARQRSLKRMVAVKFLLGGQFSDDEAKARFRREAEAAARLQHPNIVRIHELGMHENQPYFSMDYIPGTSLAKLASEGKPWGALEAADCMRVASDAVHAAHQAGILHRDIKPGNILINRSQQPFLTDFGLAKMLDSAEGLTVSGDTVGTPSYIAPEQIDPGPNQPGAAADIYSLGAVLYFLLTGRPPHVGPNRNAVLRSVISGKVTDPCRINPKVPRELADICLCCLASDPARRFATSGELSMALANWIRAASSAEGSRHKSEPPSEPVEPGHQGPSPTHRDRRTSAKSNQQAKSTPVQRNEATTGKPAREDGSTGKTVAVICGIVAVLIVALTLSSQKLSSLFPSAIKNQPSDKGSVSSFTVRASLESLAVSNKLSEAVAELAQSIKNNKQNLSAATNLIRILSGAAMPVQIEMSSSIGDGVHIAEVSRDRKRLVVVSGRGSLQVWDLVKHRRESEILLRDPIPNHVKLSAGGNRLMVAYADHVELLSISPTAAITPIHRLPLTTGIRQIDFAKVGDTVLLTLDSLGNLSAWEVPNPDPTLGNNNSGSPSTLRAVPVAEGVASFHSADSGNSILIIGTDAQAQRIDVMQLSASPIRFNTGARPITQVVPLERTSSLLLIDQSGQLYVNDLTTANRLAGPLDIGGSVARAAGHPAGEMAAVWCESGSLLMVARRGTQNLGSSLLSGSKGLIAHQFSADGLYVLSAWENGRIQLASVPMNQVIFLPIETRKPLHLAGFGANPVEFFTLSRDGELAWWNYSPPLPSLDRTILPPVFRKPLPDWFSEFVDVSLGTDAPDHANPTNTPSRVLRRKEFRDRLITLGETNTFGQWSRWFLTDPKLRSASWDEGLATVDKASRLASSGESAGIVRAIRLVPEDPQYWIQLADIQTRLPPGDRGWLPNEIAFFAQRATELSPSNPAISASRRLIEERLRR